MTSSRRSSVGDNCSNEMKKLPLKRLEVAFHKCTKIALPLHLDLLTKQRQNIRKFQTLSEWEKVHREQVNASRTVQQLTADIWEIERLRNQICNEDLEEFDKKLAPLKNETLTAIHEFLNEHKDVGNPASLLRRTSSAYNHDENCDEILLEGENLSCEKISEQQQISQSRSIMTSWKALYNDLIGLNKLIHGFSKAVEDQQPQIDLIEDNLDKTEDNVNQGAHHLGKAVGYKTVMYPVAGALIGCCAGPVGLVIGIKAGIAAAVGGGLVGYFSGNYIKKRNQKSAKSASIELHNLSKDKSLQCNSRDSIASINSNKIEK